MTSLPIIDPSVAQTAGDQTVKRPTPWRNALVATLRAVLFVSILIAIHRQHQWFAAQMQGEHGRSLSIAQASGVFPTATSLGEFNAVHGGQTVLDASGKAIGYVVQTSPTADKIVGFSGPTNTLVGLGNDNRIVGITVLSSGDTKEHLDTVVRNDSFMNRWNGLNWRQASDAQVDGVSGATLTSMAIRDSIALRFGGVNPSSRFAQATTIADAQLFFPEATALSPYDAKPSLHQVLGASGEPIGFVFRTSPHADNMIGYQGPTDTLVALTPEKRVVGVGLRESFDNQPYVRYVQEDAYFFNIFKGRTLEELASLDVVDAGIEGVSGATKTSVTVAESLVYAASEIQAEQAKIEPRERWLPKMTARGWGTVVIVIGGLTIGMTHWRGHRRLRIVLQMVVVTYLGFVNADLFSQALLVGWAQNGLPLKVAPALLLLTAAALACPVLSGRNVYCTHLCPFGCLQDWLRRLGDRQIRIYRSGIRHNSHQRWDFWRNPLSLVRICLPFALRFHVSVPRRVNKWLQRIPALLLLLVVLVAMLHWPISLVGIEPFDAFVLRIAGWATISVAVVGLVGASIVPMAYCRFGCPSGALLRYLRRHAGSGRLTLSDGWALLLAAIAWAIYI